MTDLVLVGGGHAHIQVLKDLAMRPLAGVRTTLVVDTPLAVYSGMVPGFVAGQYGHEDLEIDVVPLARLAGARVVLAPAEGLDPENRRVELAGRPPIPFDLVSIDVGSGVAGLDTPGVREHALATRPIGAFVRAVGTRIDEALRGGGDVRVVVVGAGAGGVEVAFTIDARLRGAGIAHQVLLVEAGERILPGYGDRVVARVLREAERRGIRVATGRRVESVDAAGVTIEGEEQPADLVAWVAGAAPNRGFDASRLPVDPRGFIRTEATLQIVGVPGAFAVGDCGVLDHAPWVPRAGVYAVRQGPVLVDNLRRAARGASLKAYRPQRDFLTLLNLGDGTAIGTKWGLVVSGPRTFRLKDRIDRRFVERFQVLGSEAEVRPEFHLQADMRARMGMTCGGCAAKLGQTELDRVLERLALRAEDGSVEVGVGDDAAVVRGPDGTRIVSSLDQFRALTDDPWLTGRIGAVNAASDVLAKGVEPRYAQAAIALPEGDAGPEREERLFQIMDGARVAFRELGVELIGGHTTTATELLVGFHVEGFAPAGLPLLTIDRLEEGQALVLTKRLGTGVLFHADMHGRAGGVAVERAIASMLRSNHGAMKIAREFGATAATDVTGFGLARHLGAMLRASDLSATVDVDELPALDGVEALLAAGLRSTFHEENARSASGIDFVDGAATHPNAPLLFDPQTSGGLVVGVPAAAASDFVGALREGGYPDAAAIGRTGPFAGVRLTARTGASR